MGYSRKIKWLKRFQKGTSFLDLVALSFVTFFSFFNANSFSSLEKLWLKRTIDFFFEYKESVLVISLVLIVLNKAYHKFYLIRKQPFQFRSAILEEMLNDLFNNNRDIRITLFKEVNLLKSTLYNISAFIKYYCRKVSIKAHYSRPQWGKYIQVHQRAGWEIKISNTTFFFSPNTRYHCQGIAARVIQNYEAIQETNLPDISNINLNEIDINDLGNEVVKRVNTYMERSFISDFSTLKNINAKAIHFHAEAVYGDNGPIGVLIIDCLKGDNPFNESNMPKLPHYLNLLGSTFGGNIYE